MISDSNVSNMATSAANRRQISFLREHMFKTGERLASGHRDVTDIVREGKTSDLYAMDRELSNISQYMNGIKEADLRLSSVQATLERLRTSTADISISVLASINEQPPNIYLAEVRNASGALEAIVSSLNGSVAGESLFSGANLHVSALVGASSIISDVESILTSAPDVAAAQSAVDFYFTDPAGGFNLNSYIGSSIDGPSVEVSKDQYIAQDVRADHPSIKQSIQSLAVMAAVSNGAVSSISDQKALLKTAAENNLNTNEGVIWLQQSIGHKQELLERASTSNIAKKATIEESRNRLTSVDVFEEAAKFEEFQVQLETSYSVLVRLSSLNLSNFLR